MSIIQKIFLCFAALFLTTIKIMAQTTKPEMADQLHSNGKIYVVVAVVLTILAGLFFYLIKLDRKMRKFEKQQKP